MTKKQCSLFSILFLCAKCAMVNAQSTDLFRLEYLRIPENNTGINTSRYRALVNVPLKINQNDYLILGAEYNEFDIEFRKETPFNKDEIEQLHIADFNLGYITKWNENWRLVGIVTPRLASNLKGGISSDDLFFNATASLWKEVKDVEKPFRIVLGFAFNSTTGIPIPLPLVSYYRRFHPKWSYTLGIPRANFRYHISDRHTLQLALLLDGYFINVQDDIELPDNKVGSRISLSALVATLWYQYNINKNMSFYANFGRSLILDSTLRDDNRNDVFLLNNEANLFLRGGFRISIF
ncbi:DUF6268 family outer membrane beta-barrel protein [Muricauda sp. SCSIO 64092]|uniref:DUF6268 family outer membrane beta-barrel protein n=1 Tax=Allomuricauda sp. SCSIO 64092 TaxID=2908842 RepID=UPI001FF26847|nr:DUF6268 family outer membrane beta-barrel protein [Muricauda sp. SCSIO 64092]UOY05552.1 DUF6268 family outer membrane beta-barrel protein [Muricauda sp. SCSIO 64092]